MVTDYSNQIHWRAIALSHCGDQKNLGMSSWLQVGSSSEGIPIHRVYTREQIDRHIFLLISQKPMSAPSGGAPSTNLATPSRETAPVSTAFANAPSGYA